MLKQPTLQEINDALEELALLMADCDDRQLEIFSALYAKAYTLKLRLMKETPHAGH